MLTTNDTLTFALEVAKARDMPSYTRALRNIADAVGAVAHAAQRFASDRHGTNQSVAVYDIPANFASSFNTPAVGAEDPVMRHLRTSSLPLFWDQSTYLADDRGQSHFAVMADNGLLTGVDVALHLGPNRHFVLGYSWSREVADVETRASAIALVQTVAVFAEPVLFSLTAPASDSQPPETPLTSRELECLYWISRGMTDELVASILEISHRTVRKHVDSAVLKLGAANRTEAAVRASRLGLLTQPVSRSFDK